MNVPLTFHIITRYLLQHIWDILITALIVYEILDHAIGNYRQRKAAEAAARRFPNIYNIGGEPAPIKITGRQNANTGIVSGPREIDRTGAVTIVNLVGEPITIAPRYLMVNGTTVGCRVFFQPLAGPTAARLGNILLAGSACESYRLILRFPESSEPRQATGKLCLSSSNRGDNEDDLFSVELSIA